MNSVHSIKVLPISNDDLAASIYFLVTLRMDIVAPVKNCVYLVVVTRVMDDMVRCSSGPLEIICRIFEDASVPAMPDINPGDTVAVRVTDFRFGLADEKILCLGHLVQASTVQPTILK